MEEETLSIQGDGGQYAPSGPRTRTFALRVVRLAQSLATDDVTRVLSRKILRSATSVGANYRAARRARSDAESVAKLGIVEEADESIYWLELLVDADCAKPILLDDLIREANELLAIIITCIKNARARKK